MLDIILNEFHLNGYADIGNDDGLFFLKHIDFDDFWIISSREFELSGQDEMYELYISRFATDYPTIRKNTSLVILAVEGQNTPEEIVAIENDPFLFKKYYLSYSEASEEELKDILSDSSGCYQKIEDLMVRSDVFSQLKSEPTEGGYRLLYTIAHKLPILPVMVNQEKMIEIDLGLNDEQNNCLAWCMGLSEDAIERSSAIEQFSKE